MIKPLSQMLSTANPSILFGGRVFVNKRKTTEDIALDIFQRHREEFVSVKSPSYIATKIYQYQKAGRRTKFMVKLSSYRVSLDKKLSELRDRMEKKFDLYNLKKIETYPEAIGVLKKLVKEHKVANCGEQAEILQHSLLEVGIESHILKFKIWPKNPFVTPIVRKCKDHSFVVIGVNGREHLDNPKNWGGNAFILDPWSGLTGEAKETLPKILHRFRFDSSKEKMAFFHIDPINVKEYLANISK